jgi:D-alanine--poly(phosphoribitol) ligase subunit 1
MTFLDKIEDNFKRLRDRNAFNIQERYYTYGKLEAICNGIEDIIRNNTSGKQNVIGVITYDDPETYASVFVLWFTENIFVPLNPRNPVSRNKDIIELAGIKAVLTSNEVDAGIFKYEDLKVFNTKNIEAGYRLPHTERRNPDDILYLLFTSGSTGRPKGVPISLRNLDSFVKAFISYGYKFTPDDRFLQMYDLSFDASVRWFTVPLVIGGCIYTVPQDEIKYLYALKLMSKHELTIIELPPSTLSYLRPYFKSIRLEKIRYCLFGGEALDQQMVVDWSECVPNARIQNIYGPTEATINCFIYDWDKNRPDKQFNGIVTIGRPFGDNRALVADNNDQRIKSGVMGELYIAGCQITPGYWNNQEKNDEAFVILNIDGRQERFYRTGDLAIVDDDGDFLFCGRKDEQVQIDGFRVELGEIEHHAREFYKTVSVAATAVRSNQQTLEIHLFVEDQDADVAGLKKHLESRLPYYMQPFKIHRIKEFPKSSGGKVNKQELRRMLNSES